MATTNAHSSATAKVHDGGTVLHAGEGADVITNPKNLNDFAVGGVNEYGSVVVQHSGTLAGAYNQFCDPQGVRDAGGNGGLFAYFPDQRAGDRNFLIRHAGETSAGKVNSNAGWDMHIPSRSPAASPSQPDNIHQSLTTRRLGAGGSFDVLAQAGSGVVVGRTKGSNAGVAASLKATTGDGTVAGTDDAATPTRAVPGELTYHFGGLGKPTTDEYKARDSYES
jgi:hypothetical protein